MKAKSKALLSLLWYIFLLTFTLIWICPIVAVVSFHEFFRHGFYGVKRKFRDESSGFLGEIYALYKDTWIIFKEAWNGSAD